MWGWCLFPKLRAPNIFSLFVIKQIQYVCSWRATSIGNNTKIDNQVQVWYFYCGLQNTVVMQSNVSHFIFIWLRLDNVVIGHSCMICGQAGIGGSATLVTFSFLRSPSYLKCWSSCQWFLCRIGDYVVLAGQTGVADHVSIVSKVISHCQYMVNEKMWNKGHYVKGT